MDREEVLEGLRDAGLTEYQADAYLTVLEEGTSQAVDVARRCSVPGPRIYDVLKELEQRGYVETVDRDTLHVRACDPVDVIDDLHRRSERLSNVASDIEDRWERSPLTDHRVNVTKRAATAIDHASEVIPGAETSVDLAVAPAEFVELHSVLRGADLGDVIVRVSMLETDEADVDDDILESVATEVRTRNVEAPFLAIVDRTVTCFAPTNRLPEPHGIVVNDAMLTFVTGWYFQTCLWSAWEASYRDEAAVNQYVSLEECMVDVYELWRRGARIHLSVEGTDTETGDTRTVEGEMVDVWFSGQSPTDASPALIDFAGVLTVVLESDDVTATVGGWGARAEDLEAQRITVTNVEFPFDDLV